jgi:hypothetical protein
MIYEIKMYQGGKTFIETVHANDVKSAKETAQVRNPHCRIVGANPVLR